MAETVEPLENAAEHVLRRLFDEHLASRRPAAERRPHDQTKSSSSSGPYPMNVARTMRAAAPATPGTSWIEPVLKK